MTPGTIVTGRNLGTEVMRTATVIARDGEHVVVQTLDGAQYRRRVSSLRVVREAGHE
jgi:hypothetical protein